MLASVTTETDLTARWCQLSGLASFVARHATGAVTSTNRRKASWLIMKALDVTASTNDGPRRLLPMNHRLCATSEAMIAPVKAMPARGRTKSSKAASGSRRVRLLQ